jgi:hypothetical protein
MPARSTRSSGGTSWSETPTTASISTAPVRTVTGNDADRNGDLGIDAVIGVLDGGANAASRNSNPLQYVNVSR